MTMQENAAPHDAFLNHQQTKQKAFEIFIRKYHDLVMYVNALNIPHNLKMNGIMRGDECMFWVREGIDNMPMPPVDSQPLLPSVVPPPQGECVVPLESPPLG